MGIHGIYVLIFIVLGLICGIANSHSNQPLSRINIHRVVSAKDTAVSIEASPTLLGTNGDNVDYVTVKFKRPYGASESDWIGVFSPAIFNASLCTSDRNVTNQDYAPFLCTAPVKYQYTNFSNSNYLESGSGSLKFRLVNQRADFTFAYFSGGLDDPVLLGVSESVVTFANTKAPSYPRLALTDKEDEMSVTWTSGFSPSEATPVVSWWSMEDYKEIISVAKTLTFGRSDMCGSPARSVGWRDPGYIHTAYFRGLSPCQKYAYAVGHRFQDGSYFFEKIRNFSSAPYPGQESMQQIIIFGDMGKGERDQSSEYNNLQPGALITTDALIKDLGNIDLIFHIGDLCYANGYLSQWDQFTEQIEPLASQVPYMLARGNHERDWPGTGSFYQNIDSGGECGVPLQTMFNMPVKNSDKYWYSLDYGLFRFCVTDSEQDWREGTEQYKFIEECLASADRLRQPWLIFISHRALGYSSSAFYANEGSFGEPMGRESLQKLWQKYKVDLAIFGHSHNYERTCPVYENICVSTETSQYSGVFNATIHLVIGGAGASLNDFTEINTSWSIFKDVDYGFGKLTALSRTSLKFEYKRSTDGQVYDSFLIHRQYHDVLGCDTINNCPPVTIAE